MKNLQLHEKLTIAGLTDEERKIYVEFIKLLFVLARETKRAFKNNPDISNSELPHIVLISKLDKLISLSFSVTANSWVLYQAIDESDFKSKFNPTAITGVILFLDKFKTDVVSKAIETTYNQIDQLKSKNG